MSLFGSISALKLPHYKGTAACAGVRVAPPAEVLLPMTMHSGGAAVPVVEVGQHVYLGQLIAKEDGRNSSNIHASVSGTVKAIEEYEQEKGRKVQAIRLESDGKMEKDPSIAPPEIHDLDSFLNSLHDSGIVGLGGAAFPLWGKLDAARKSHIKTVLVNGAECEPFITSDHRTMLDNTDLIVKGVDILREYLKSEEFIIGIEENKPDAIDKLRNAFADKPYVNVKPLKSVYPQGAKQLLLYNGAGLVVKEGQRLAALGCIIINITTLTKMAEFVTTGMPLVERCLTVDGSAVKEPKNLIVPVGTPARYLLEQCGGAKAPVGKLIFGGPMMGKTGYSLDQPIVKASNAVVLLSEKDAKALEPTDCIHCGRCDDTCPLGLNPKEYTRVLEEVDDADEQYRILEKEHILTCMECGCCSYVCPAHRPLVENNRKAKGIVKKVRAAQKEAAGK